MSLNGMGFVVFWCRVGETNGERRVDRIRLKRTECACRKHEPSTFMAGRLLDLSVFITPHFPRHDFGLIRMAEESQG